MYNICVYHLFDMVKRYHHPVFICCWCESFKPLLSFLQPIAIVVFIRKLLYYDNFLKILCLITSCILWILVLSSGV